MSSSVPPREVFTAASNLLPTTEAFVKAFMSKNDPSHDWAHIERVVRLSKLLTRPTDDPILVHLSALLHDVADAKYVPEDSTTYHTPSSFLLQNSAPVPLAVAVDCICSNVSYSKESKNPKKVEEVLKVYPELAVVQDADRLDAIGAVGIARCFAFGSAKKPERGLEGCVDHFEDKLARLEGMMKTEMGKEMARERTRRIKEFERWWRDETEGGIEANGGFKGDPTEDTYSDFENI